MHPAPSLAELLKADDPRAQQQPGQPDQQELSQDQLGSAQPPEIHSPSSVGSSPHLPARKDTGSSTSTAATDATVTTDATTDSGSTAYSVESSQSIFSAKDGVEVSSNRRASRRRTGPLSAAQREKAALIRKLGACTDCRRRRVACHPNHHNMTWEDAIRKYQRAHSPMQDLAPLVGRPISPASSMRHGFTHDPQEMDIDSTPTPPASRATPGRAPLGESRIRTPLPLGPRLEKHMSMPPLASAPPSAMALPNIDHIKSELETTASRLLSRPHSGRYSNVLALLICWQDDRDLDVSRTVEQLRVVFAEYAFSSEIIKIPPSSSDGCKNSARWLSRLINDFTDNNDTRDFLKLIYYNGSTLLDDNGEMVLASPDDTQKASVIRWSGIQDFLEGACSDTLIIFDAVFHPSPKAVRQKGVLELIAASASEEDYNLLGRNNFTRALTQQLRARTSQRLASPLSAADLYGRLLSAYPKIVQEKKPEGPIASLPLPLHLQVSGSPKLPSITLSPMQAVSHAPETPGGPQLMLSIRLADEHVDIDNWAEWLRMMPDGVKAVKVEGPYSTFR